MKVILNSFRGCELHKGVFVGRGTIVGSNTEITNSVIGKDCNIGNDACDMTDHILT